MAVVLALPGWGTSSDRLEPMCAHLRGLGARARPWRYDASGSIDSIASELAEVVASDGGPVHLVGHSLGGLAAASAVLDHGAHVASVTTINSPWRGTWVAWTADRGEKLGHELRWGSSRLADLRERLADHLDLADGPRWTLLAAGIDLAASPATSLRVAAGPRLETDLVPVTGHSLSLMKEPMIDRVAAAIGLHDDQAAAA